jgi:hypothetical protein
MGALLSNQNPAPIETHASSHHDELTMTMTMEGEAGIAPERRKGKPRRAWTPWLDSKKGVRSFVGLDGLDIYKTFGDAAVGTRVRKLRHGVSYSHDLITGEAGNPDGPARTYRDGSAQYLVPEGPEAEAGSKLRVTPSFLSGLEGSLPPSVLEGGDMHGVAKWLVYQTGPQCYIAAALNVLLSIAPVRAVLDKALDLARDTMPDVFSRYIMAGVFPLSIALPTGLALLQIYASLRARAHFQVTPLLQGLEKRLGPRREPGGNHSIVFLQMLTALGFTWKTHAMDRTRTSVPSRKDSLAEDFCVGTFIVPDDPVRDLAPCAGSVLVGGFLAVLGHVIAALPGGIVYDSNDMVPVRMPWESTPENDMVWRGEPIVGRGAVFASTKLMQASPETVLEHAHAVLEAMFKHVNPVPFGPRHEKYTMSGGKGRKVEMFEISESKQVQTVWYEDDIPMYEVWFKPQQRRMTIAWLQANSRPKHVSLSWNKGFFPKLPSIKVDHSEKERTLHEFAQKYNLRALSFLHSIPARTTTRGQSLARLLGEMNPAFVHLLESIPRSRR